MSEADFSQIVAMGKQFDEKVIPNPAILEMGMTEADFSNKNLGAGGAIIIAAWLTHKDKGALSLLNLTDNSIGGVWVQKIKEMCGSRNTPLGHDYRHRCRC